MIADTVNETMLECLENQRCHRCNGAIIYPEGIGGEKICSKCGIVIDDAPSIRSDGQWSPEWYSNWTQDDSETLKEWLTILRSVSCQLNLPSFPFREEAARKIRTQRNVLFKSQKLSKNKRATVAALIQFILKEYNKNRSLKEISRELSLDNSIVEKQAWVLKKTLALQEPIRITRKTAINYLHEYASKITTNKELIQHAESTLLQLKRAGGNPIGVAAGAFYNSCKKNKIKISKEKIGEIFKISERTVYTNEARIRKLMSASSKAT